MNILDVLKEYLTDEEIIECKMWSDNLVKELVGTWKELAEQEETSPTPQEGLREYE